LQIAFDSSLEPPNQESIFSHFEARVSIYVYWMRRKLVTLRRFAANPSAFTVAIFDGRDFPIRSLQALRLHAPKWPIHSGIHRIMVRVVFLWAFQLARIVKQSFRAKAFTNLAGLDELLQARRLQHVQAPSFAASSSARFKDTTASCTL